MTLHYSFEILLKYSSHLVLIQNNQQNYQMCVRACMHVCAYVYVRLCTCTRAHVRMFVCVCMCACARVCVCVRMCVCESVWMRKCVGTCVPVCKLMHVHRSTWVPTNLLFVWDCITHANLCVLSLKMYMKLGPFPAVVYIILSIHSCFTLITAIPARGPAVRSTRSRVCQYKKGTRGQKGRLYCLPTRPYLYLDGGFDGLRF